MGAPIDPDDKTTWPMQIKNQVNRWAEQLRDTKEFTNDLELPLEWKTKFRKMFSDYPLRAYHCTHLLPHEFDWIKEKGLQPLSLQLIHDRIDLAYEKGFIERETAEKLKSNNVYANHNQKNREGHISLILSKNQIKTMLSGIQEFLTRWGGEGIYWPNHSKPLYDRLKGIGKPSIAVANIDIDIKDSQLEFYPELHKIFVGAALELSDMGGEVKYMAPIPAKSIEKILQPGDYEYNSLGELPIN
jgi:hypothetical protein